jgi:sugar lactone lactonase YvrE
MNTRALRLIVTILLISSCAALAGCKEKSVETVAADSSADAVAQLPRWTFDASMVFPADGSLARVEDGVALPDGRLIVTDQPHGLRRIESDGTSAPFGEMAAAGYVHEPPAKAGGANGVSLEPDGANLLVADVFRGGIYRVDVATGATSRIHQHRYGVNTAVRDSTGAVWFTQSAHNTAEEGEARMWAAVGTAAAEGALLRLGMKDGQLAEEADVLIDSLQFANGLAIDEQRGFLYFSEIVGGRVYRYRVDVASGQLTDGSVLADDLWIDNLELDGRGNLWMAAPLANELVVIDPATGARHSAFRAQTPAQSERSAEIARRARSAEPYLELFTPELWSPLPGLLTGVIISPDDGPVYLTGLGNALVKLPR